MQHDFVLLDRSQSMSSQWGEAIAAVNRYVHKLAEENVDTGVTLAAFDRDAADQMSFTILRERILPKTWRDVDPKEAPPRGNTPLNDATARIVSLARDGNYEKVAIIIMTDGMENASREYTTEQIKRLLDDCRAKDWQIIFLGANFDNAAQAQSYGNAAAATVQSTPVNYAATMDSLGSTRSLYAKGRGSMTFTAEEKARFKSDTPTTTPGRGGVGKQSRQQPRK